MARPTTTLLQNGNETGADHMFLGGSAHLMATCGNWNGASMKLQTRAPDNTYIDVEGTELSDNGQIGVRLGPCYVRVAVEGEPAGLNVWLTHFKD